MSGQLWRHGYWPRLPHNIVRHFAKSAFCRIFGWCVASWRTMRALDEQHGMRLA